MYVYDGGMIGTQNVIDAINASGSVKRIVYTSSMAAVSGARRATVPKGYQWSETDWASDGVDPERWQSPRNAYARSKVDTEHLINRAADASGGRWNAITMNPAMICGPILFKAKEVLGATIRPVEDTIRAVVESSVELGIIDPQIAEPV